MLQAPNFIGTAGRLADHIRRKNYKQTNAIKILVFGELIKAWSWAFMKKWSLSFRIYPI
ncbi:MAG: hypothetical protein IPJ31_12875 [Bacteroidetes bacterium]|nr:hypothetical protein [Bacteroidota bacterium]